MKRISVTLAGLFLLTFMALPASADVFFRQSAENTSAWISETSNGTDGFNQVFDNFTFATTGTSTGVEWTGWVLPSFGTISGFTINFYNDALNGSDHVPGTLISSTLISGAANQVNSGTHGSYGVFDFNAAVPFTGIGGTQYWISIVADPQGSTWHWANSNQGDSSFYEDDGNGNAGPVGTDVAFSLVSPAPEPSSFVLCGTGLAAMVGVARRRLVTGRA